MHTVSYVGSKNIDLMPHAILNIRSYIFTRNSWLPKFKGHGADINFWNCRILEMQGVPAWYCYRRFCRSSAIQHSFCGIHFLALHKGFTFIVHPSRAPPKKPPGVMTASQAAAQETSTSGSASGPWSIDNVCRYDM